jgi:hypothetical protein
MLPKWLFTKEIRELETYGTRILVITLFYHLSLRVYYEDDHNCYETKKYCFLYFEKEGGAGLVGSFTPSTTWGIESWCNAYPYQGYSSFWLIKRLGKTKSKRYVFTIGSPRNKDGELY